MAESDDRHRADGQAPHRSVWKYPIGAPVVDLVMPHGSQIIDVRCQDGVPTMWALANVTAPKVTRTFLAFGTGHPIFEPALRYVGSAHDVADVGLVFHIFERPSERSRCEATCTYGGSEMVPIRCALTAGHVGLHSPERNGYGPFGEDD